MFRRLQAVFERSEADRLAAVLDEQRAEQRNAEAYLIRLREARDAVVRRLGVDRGSEDASVRLAAQDREIAWTADRVRRALALQAQLLARLGETVEVAEDRRT